MRNVLHKILFILPILWICGISLTQSGMLRLDRSTDSLKDIQVWILKYQSEFHRLPWSIAEIRIFAKSLESSFSPYDSFGMRLQYVPLNEKAFILKSFGSDATEDTYGSNDDSILTQGLDLNPQGIPALRPNQSVPLFYQANFLEGLSAPETGLVARLEVNSALHKRFLLVSDPQRAQFAMVSFHDGVEEFLWLPSGYELIFTALGSDRYEDGIYYWNLKDGTSHNIFADMRRMQWPKIDRAEPFYLSLSHVSDNPPLLYILAQPAAQAALDPQTFYRFKNLYAINLDSDLTHQPGIQKVPANAEDSAFDYPASHLSLNVSSAGGSLPQKAWRKLRLQGEAEPLIDQWQQFCSDFPLSPTLPYGLWWLASIYNDTFRMLKETAPDEALVIRNYGVEIAEALSTMPMAPAYLRAMAEHLRRSLLQSRVASYRVSELSQDLIPDESP